MTAPQQKAMVLDTLAGGVPDLSKPETARRFAEIIGAGKLEQLTPGQQSVFLAGLGAYLGIKPELGDLMIYEGRPYITIGGYRRIAHNTGLLNGIQTEPASERDRDRFPVTAKEHLWKTMVHKKGQVRPYTGWGYVRERELVTKQGRNGPYEPVTMQYPQEMAKKRSIYDALRLAFPPLEIIGEIHMKYIDEAEREAARIHPATRLADGDYSDTAMTSEVRADATESVIEEPPPEREPGEEQEIDERELDDFHGRGR